MNLKSLLASGVVVLLMSSLPIAAFGESYGAAGAKSMSDKSFTLEQMLRFAIEDEYLARGEYQKIIETYGSRKPYSNIVKAEERHISWLEPLFTKYGFALPVDKGMESAVLPATYQETFPIGVTAEVNNIAMYERFLKQDLPSDVKDVFIRLRDASKNHLAAFQKFQTRFQ